MPPRGGTVHVYTMVQPAPYASAAPTTEAAPTSLPGPGTAGAVIGLLAAAGRLRGR